MLRLLVRAILLFSLVNAPAIFEHLRYSGNSPACFSDMDEAYYFDLALTKYASYDYKDVLKADGNVPYSHAVFSPQSVVNIVLGKLATAMHLRICDVSILLDLLCFTVSYLIYNLLFRLFSQSRATAEIAVVSFLCLPWSFAPGRLFHVSILWFNRIVSAPVVPWFCLPILRGPYVQLSYPVVGLCLYAVVRAIQNSDKSRVLLTYAGICSGLLIYVYWFAWVSVTAIISITLLMTSWVAKYRKKPTYAVPFFQVMRFLVANGFMAVAGLVVLSMRSAAKSFALFDNIPTYWYFSVEGVVALLLCLLFAVCGRRFRDIGIALMLAASCIVAEFVLMNIQPAIRVSLYPYHFNVFYLSPLFSGIMSILLLDYFPHLFRSMNFQVISRSILSVSILFFAIISPLKRLHVLAYSIGSKEESEVIEYVKTRIDANSVIDVPKFPSGSVMADWFKALTSRPPFVWEWDFGISRQEKSKRLLIHNLLFDGNFSIPFLDSPGPRYSHPRDLFISGRSDYAFSPLALGLIPSQHLIPKGYTPCQALSEFAIDYAVRDNAFVLVKPDWYDLVMTEIWTSSKGKYSILRVSQDNARSFFCSPVD